MPITANRLCSYGGLLDSLSTAHHASHGVHEGALVQGDEVLIYTEDIGRHNVLDRLRGFVELQHIDVSQAVLVFSGRVPQSVIEKVHGMGVRFLASRALPTSLGVSNGQAVRDYPGLRLAARLFQNICPSRTGFAIVFDFIFCYNMKRDSLMVVHRLSLLIL